MTTSTLSPTHICPGCGATLGNNFTRCPACDAEQPPQPYFDAEAETDVIPATQIKTLADGREAYYPWGILGQGYALKDEASRAHVRQFQRRWRIARACLCLSFAGALLLKNMRGPEYFDDSFSLWLLVAIVSAILLKYWFGWFFSSRLIARLERVDERLTLNELILKRASMTSPMLLVLELICNLFILAVCPLFIFVLPPHGFPYVEIGVLLYLSVLALGTLGRIAEYVYAMLLRLRVYERGA